MDVTDREFALSREAVARFEYLPEAGSTNDVLVEHAMGTDAAAWPDLSVVVTDSQTQGRGRLGRSWLAPTGKSLAISVLLRPSVNREPLGAEHFGWFPLLAGAAMTIAVREVVEAATATAAAAAHAPSDGQRTGKSSGKKNPAHNGTEPEDAAPRHEVTLKWPNDVLIDGYKVSGILSELLPGANGLVVGAGLNVALDEHDLPTLTSTSLLLVTGRAPDPDAVLARYLTELGRLYRRYLAAGGDPVASGLRAEVAELCGTLGEAVRVELPGGADLVGTAVDLDVHGRLVVRDQADNELQAVAAGDVTHLRY
ncbi:biotin--[acetyl-CoA-carboxylase] ligase [Glaciibacter sp. 2TAF33]|uniref:biotin--[acetyl-CoA-carboxylase] ligase n=1 Tax=Glaciibacter sp. 2TAF33 TaxID=3233015 RepID=UPI003F93B4F2